MDWSDWAVWLLLAALIVNVVLYVRIMRKNRRLHALADESNRLRHAAEATEQRNRQLKQEMTSNLAHELKTPVASIRGYLEILLGPHAVDEQQRRHYLERCLTQTLRLSELIQDVSLINKLEESASLFPCSEVDVRHVLQEVCDEFASAAAERSVRLHNDLPPMPLVGNAELLYRLFRNLVENAVSYAGSDIDVVVEPYSPQSLLPAGRYYYIHFYDTGCGVPEEYLSRLFDRFVRIGEGRSRREGGTGLGLSIVKHAVQFHRGEIYVQGRPEGGLEFFFSLKCDS